MRTASFSAAQTTRLSHAFLDEPLPARTKTLAAIIASFASIPGWVVRKPHIRAVAFADGFDAAWAALLHAGILSCARTRTPQGRYEYAYTLDRARVCGGEAFTLVPNELLLAELPMNARWLYIVCARWMSVPHFVFDRERLRYRVGFGHDRFQHAYAALRHAGWLDVTRVPGQKRRCYALTRRTPDGADRIPVWVSGAPTNAPIPTPARALPTRRPIVPAEPDSECPDYHALLRGADCPPDVLQSAVRVFSAVHRAPRPRYRIDGHWVDGHRLRAALTALSAAQLHELLHRVGLVPHIRNLAGYLLAACYRESFAPGTDVRADAAPQSDASYDLAAFDRMTLYGTLDPPNSVHQQK